MIPVAIRDLDRGDYTQADAGGLEHCPILVLEHVEEGILDEATYLRSHGSDKPVVLLTICLRDQGVLKEN